MDLGTTTVVVALMVEKFMQGFAKRLQERGGRGEGGRRLGFKGAAPQPSPPPYIGVRGLWGAPQSHLGPAKGGNLPPKEPN